MKLCLGCMVMGLEGESTQAKSSPWGPADGTGVPGLSKAEGHRPRDGVSSLRAVEWNKGPWEVTPHPHQADAWELGWGSPAQAGV